MRKKLAVLFLGAALTVSMLGACGGKDAASSSASAVSASSAADASSASVQDASKAESSTSTSDVSAESASAAETAGESSASELEDGTYTADFNTDSNMFHVNEAKEGKGVLTVKDGKMTPNVEKVEVIRRGKVRRAAASAVLQTSISAWADESRSTRNLMLEVPSPCWQSSV